MDRARFLGTLLTALGLCVSAPAQERMVAPVETAGPSVYVEPYSEMAPTDCGTPWQQTGSPYGIMQPGRTSAVREWLRRCHACCWSHHNNLGCSTLKSEAIFLFGSCRAFYGETCLPRPADIDHHGWWYRYGRY
jgi:hypothetical protein